MKKKNIITNSHDQFFRESMKDKRVATEFLKAHLPAEILALVDFDDLVLQPRLQANKVRKESEVDVLFKTKIGGKESYIYLLLEHQSSPDPLMAFRILQYVVNVIEEHLKANKSTNTIPFVYPLVVYHGKPYNFITDINDIVDAPRNLVDQYFLKPFQLLDLSKVDDAVIRQKMFSGIMEFVLKHIFERDMLPFLKDIMPIFKLIHENSGDDFIGIVLQYVIQRAELSDENEFIELINQNISHETGDAFMSLAEKWYTDGELKGKLEGGLEAKIQVAKNMILAGSELVFVVTVTGLSMAEVKAIQSELDLK
jgi:predicted transposase/invertase (TIGR01784 family)